MLSETSGGENVRTEACNKTNLIINVRKWSNMPISTIHKQNAVLSLGAIFVIATRRHLAIFSTYTGTPPVNYLNTAQFGKARVAQLRCST